MAALFVSGTDTGIGKTWITAGLVRELRALGIDAVGMKPIASGCERTARGWRNDDALALLRASGFGDDDYARVNPIALPLPASPHIAAADAGTVVDLDRVAGAYADLHRRHTIVLVEGVGGWSVPLSAAPPAWRMQCDLVRALDLRVLLVVGLRLGCINHALLSARAIAADGGVLSGWIGNVVDDDDGHAAMIDTLRELLPSPHLGTVARGCQVTPELARAVAGLMAAN